MQITRAVGADAPPNHHRDAGNGCGRSAGAVVTAPPVPVQSRLLHQSLSLAASITNRINGQTAADKKAIIPLLNDRARRNINEWIRLPCHGNHTGQLTPTEALQVVPRVYECDPFTALEPPQDRRASNGHWITGRSPKSPTETLSPKQASDQREREPTAKGTGAKRERARTYTSSRRGGSGGGRPCSSPATP